MSLKQPATPGATADPAPKLQMAQSTGVTLNSDFFTMMVWAIHTDVGVAIAYHDLMCVRDSSIGADPSDDKIIGIYNKTVAGPIRIVSMGDVEDDVDAAIALPINQWRHYTLVSEDRDGQEVEITSYVDGVEHVRSHGVTVALTPPIFPHTDCFIQLFNSRSSATDSGSVWQGHMAGFKCWNNVALTPEEIKREMWTYVPIRKAGLYAALPMINKAHAALDLTGKTWSVVGTDFVDGDIDPPGVVWENKWKTRTITQLLASAALSGTITAATTEADIVAGGKTVILTLTGDTYIPN